MTLDEHAAALAMGLEIQAGMWAWEDGVPARVLEVRDDGDIVVARVVACFEFWIAETPLAPDLTDPATYLLAWAEAWRRRCDILEKAFDWAIADPAVPMPEELREKERVAARTGVDFTAPPANPSDDDREALAAFLRATAGEGE